MPYENLKKKLTDNNEDSDEEDEGNFKELPVNILGTDGLNPNGEPKSFLGEILHKTLGIGNDQTTSDSIQPVISPIDLAVGALGSKLGTAMTQDAGQIIGNDVGAINFGKGVIDKTDPVQPIGRVFREETVLPKPNYGKVILKPDSGPGFYPTKIMYPRLKSKLK